MIIGHCWTGRSCRSVVANRPSHYLLRQAQLARIDTSSRLRYQVHHGNGPIRYSLPQYDSSHCHRLVPLSSQSLAATDFFACRNHLLCHRSHRLFSRAPRLWSLLVRVQGPFRLTLDLSLCLTSICRCSSFTYSTCRLTKRLVDDSTRKHSRTSSSECTFRRFVSLDSSSSLETRTTRLLHFLKVSFDHLRLAGGRFTNSSLQES